MDRFDRLPALPLIVNDPFFSYWLPSDTPIGANVIHWTGRTHRIAATVVVDGVPYDALGNRRTIAASTVTGIRVTPTRTIFEEEAAGVRWTLTFRTPALPDDLDVLSTPITYVEFRMSSCDGKEHAVRTEFSVPDDLCYNTPNGPRISRAVFRRNDLNIALVGQKEQRILSQSGDLITIDWGYLYLASEQKTIADGNSLRMVSEQTIGSAETSFYAMVGYDDIASINYFGVPCRAWCYRSGGQLVDRFEAFADRYDELLARCEALDEQVMADALKAGGADYQKIAAASWRHTFAAHKLIATPKGEMAFLSKENNSNGCIGTVDVSYPSIPLFLKYAPELVNALARPVLEYAAMPCWGYDFAPHDVGRYPHVTGQVYSKLPDSDYHQGDVNLPTYLFDAQTPVFRDENQMPVEESGNMLIMMWTAIHYGADDKLAKQYKGLLDQWVHYLDEYGDDPGNQLCTDDFAGHLAHNVNLSAKALMGIKCYAKLQEHFGDTQKAAFWNERAEKMAHHFLERVTKTPNTPLTFDGEGWSMKYNLVWDKVLHFGLLPDAFYEKETRSYLPRLNRYGLPLDSRKDYTKSDWACWCAAMASDREVRQAILAPIAAFLEETPTRVPFSDWYDTKSGCYVAFIARSVQGGVFMPMLTD